MEVEEKTIEAIGGLNENTTKIIEVLKLHGERFNILETQIKELEEKLKELKGE